MQEDHLRELLVSGLSGDADRYRLFLEELSAHLRAYLRRRLARLPDEVEDVLQELLIAIHNKRHSYDPRRPLTAWVQAIARYKLTDLHRRRARVESRHETLDEEEPLFATDNDASEARYDIAQLLSLLPERQRLPILCVKLEGASVSDTARRTGMSPSAVKIGIHRGLKALAEKLRSMS